MGYFCQKYAMFKLKKKQKKTSYVVKNDLWFQK